MKIFLDLDGVVADFAGGIIKLFDIKDYRIPFDHRIHKWEGFPKNQSEIWKKVRQQRSKFWRELDKYPWSDKLVKLCEDHGDMYFLTSPVRDNPWCSSGKMQWIHHHYPQVGRRIVITPYKHLLASEDAVLIDDTVKKIDEFKAAGGNTILFPQLWNGQSVENKLEFVKNKLYKL